MATRDPSSRTRAAVAWRLLVGVGLVAAVWGCPTRGPQPLRRPAFMATAPTPSVASTAGVGATRPPAATDAAASGYPRAGAPAWASAAPFVSPERFDLLIVDGTVVDGTGAAPTGADVLIDRGRIVHVGRVDRSVKAGRIVSGAGLVVAPGFIDAHAHGDPDHDHASSLAQGVTTLCLGQDGHSTAGDLVSRLVARVGQHRLALNAALLVGHGTVRNLTGVGLAERPSEPERARMARLVERELAAGAFGLTTGLEYLPGSRADLEELVALGRPVAAVDGIVMSHLRREDEAEIDAALDELVAQGKRSGARVHVSHLKVVHGQGSARAERLLARLEQARGDGVRVTADIYPYEASYTTIGIVFPQWAKPPASYERVARERRDELADFLRRKVAARNGPEAMLFGTGRWRGETLGEVAAATGRPFEEVLIDQGPEGASAAHFVMDEPLQARLLVDPHVMIGSDGGPATRHPRASGTFARVIRRYVVEERRLTLAQAIYKMTGLPAAALGLDRQARGLLRAGWAADVVVLDPAAFRDRATYAEPDLLAEGMRWVIVNGVVAIADGLPTGVRGGKLLLRQGAAEPRRQRSLVGGKNGLRVGPRPPI